MNPQQRQRYLNQQDTIETLYTFHPEEFERLSKNELDLLDKYYFLKREIDVEDIAVYAADLVKDDVTIQQRAETVLWKVLAVFKFDERQIEDLLPEK